MTFQGCGGTVAIADVDLVEMNFNICSSSNDNLIHRLSLSESVAMVINGGRFERFKATNFMFLTYSIGLIQFFYCI